ncbi:MAG: UDP-N-acetylglucosamine 1-carboxyvinyltransferase [Oscillospiraceae bacterium]|nr:UDP-N-acetylglucosamine 1-carboxyvinyltransferase [Oscillospiraceae bacterium]
MSVWRIKGGSALEGSLTIQGAKNAVLPILAATILTGCETELTNCPALRDVEASLNILRYLGCRVERREDVIRVDSRPMTGCAIPNELTREMRSSVIFLGAVLARCGESRLSMPGGCELGPRPIDLHLSAMEALGSHVRAEGGEICCFAPTLRGGTVHLELPSVGATENAMIAACAARGETVITNAAREPEIVDLQNFLRAMGADIDGAGTPVVTIHSFTPADRVGYRIMPDRIAAATMLCACACAGGDVELRGIDPRQTESVTENLEAMGAEVARQSHRLRIRCRQRLRGGRTVITRPYPGFPTDAQPLMMAASLKAEGTTVFVENIFTNRYRQTEELKRLGANIRTEGRVAIITGVERLHGAPVLAEDLRGGASLILAGLGAEGETAVTDRGHVDRGYEGLDKALNALGAQVMKYESEN